MTRHVTTSERETLSLAKKIAGALRGGDVIALYGNLGTGKTVFAKGIAAGLGVKKPITSPTFTLMNVYPIKKNSISQLVHIDCYRLKNSTELKAIGINEYLNNPHVVTLVEWAERAKSLLTKDTVTVSLEMTKDNRRTITINHRGKFWSIPTRS